MTDAASDQPVEGVSVVLIGAEGAEAGSVVTGSSGGYTIDGLAAGEYRVSFSHAPTHEPQFWPRTADVSGAEAVSIAEGQAAVGIDAALIPASAIGEAGAEAADPSVSPNPTESAVAPDSETAVPSDSAAGRSVQEGPTESASDVDQVSVLAIAPAPAGTISGTVTAAATGQPISFANVNVSIDGPSQGPIPSVSTAVDGTFTFSNLPAASYVVSYSAAGYARQYFDGTQQWASATRVVVSAEQGAAGVNAALATEATISGVVRDANGNPVVNANVSATGVNGGGGYDATDVNGVYTLTGLGADSYRISFSAAGYASEFYDSTSYQNATLVPVATAEVRTGIDAVLEVPGQISGRVLDHTGQPLAGTGVSIFTGSSFGYATTGADGRYTITGLMPASDYIVQFSGNNENTWEYYSDATDPADATKVTVTAGATTANIDAQLERAFTISGVVTDAATAQPITREGLGVNFLDSSGTPWIGDGIWDGAFSLGGFRAGQSYYVSVIDSEGAYATQYWEDAPTLDQATLITIGEEDVELSFALDPAANITGTVTAEETPAPAEVTLITAYRWSGAEWSSVVEITGWSGYELQGLPSGTYTVGFSEPDMPIEYPYCPEFWDGQLTADTADRFDLAAGATRTGIDAELATECDLPDITPGDVSISGNPRVGSTLTANPGTWGPDPVELSYQWLADGTPIPGQTGTTLPLTGDMLGANVSLQVTGSRPGYESATATSASVKVLDVLQGPAPVISGEPVAGQTLTVTTGTWTPAPVQLTYQWLADGAAVAGATGAEFVPGTAEVGKMISVRVTGSKTNYVSLARVSAEVGPVTAAPLPDLTAGTPVIVGDLVVGGTVTVQPGSWGPAPVSLTYQWLVGGEAVAGATGDEYVLQPGDQGKTVSVVVRGTKEGYNPATRTATAEGTVTPGQITAATATITGVPRVDSVLTANTGTWQPAAVSFTYQWLADSVTIPGATGVTFTPAAEHVGAYISVAVTGSKPGYQNAVATSEPVGPVVEAELTAGTVTISGTPLVGTDLTANPGAWGPGSVELAYQWFRDGVPIEGATNATYTATVADVGAVLGVTVTGTKPGYASASRTATATAAVAPHVTLDKSTVAPSETVTVIAEGFGSEEDLLVELLHSTPVTLAETTATADGSLEVQVTIPAGTELGEHAIVVTGLTTERSAQAPISIAVTPGPTPVPSPSGTAAAPASPAPLMLSATGVSMPWGLLAIGMVLVLSGIVVARRNARV